MGGKTDYYRNKLLDGMRGVPLSFPATWYLALFRQSGGAPSAAGGGTEVPGPVGTTGYQRFALPGDLATWFPTQGSGAPGAASSGTTGRMSNAVSITFGTPLANWGATTSDPIAYWALMDAPTGGNAWLVGQIAMPVVKNAGDPALVFPPDALAIYEV